MSNEQYRQVIQAVIAYRKGIIPSLKGWNKAMQSLFLKESSRDLSAGKRIRDNSDY